MLALKTAVLAVSIAVAKAADTKKPAEVKIGTAEPGRDTATYRTDLEPDFRVVTKNILASVWTKLDWYKSNSPNDLYFAPRMALQRPEFERYAADLLTLQEMDRWDESYLGDVPSGIAKPSAEEIVASKGALDETGLYWGPTLQSLGYKAIFSSLGPIPGDSSSTKSSVGQSLAWLPTSMTIMHSGTEHMYETLAHLPNQRANMFTYAVMKHTGTGNELIIITCHLYYADMTARLHQIIEVLTQAHALRTKYPAAPVLITGDFNTRPDDLALGYALRNASTIERLSLSKHIGTIKDRLKTPEAIARFQGKMAIIGESAPARDLLASHGTTHKTSTFEGRLDYMLTIDSADCTTKLSVVRELLVPQYGDHVKPMPNPTSGSDHYALVADLAFVSV